MTQPIDQSPDKNPDQALIQQIHQASGKFVMAVTGGGTAAVTRLLAEPGASNTLLAAAIPYHPDELSRYLGAAPDQACSESTARALAMVSWQRAREICAAGEPAFGVGCTAALATNRQRRGTDRCFIALQSATTTMEYAIVFDNTDRSRAEEEQLCSRQIITMMATALGLEAKTSTGFRDTDQRSKHQVVASKTWQSLLSGEKLLGEQLLGAKTTNNTDSVPPLLFPGAFNPMHRGHQKMIEVAENLTGMKATLEISIINVDKPALDFIEMERRETALNKWPLVFSNAATFVEKARAFPGSTFMVGIDTLTRIIDSKYYGNSEQNRDAALHEIRELGNQFLVFGRSTDEGYRTLSDLDLPAVLNDICSGVSEQAFREEISSSEIRQQQATNN